MISIQCPSCSTPLEIDDGFHGGVCRCSGCGTLMTVPDDLKKGRAESLKRPEVPEGSPRPAPNTYTTASGKKLQLTENQVKKAPLAKKRHTKVHFAVWGVMGLVALFILVGVAGLGYFLFHKPPPATTKDIYAELFGDQKNPYTIQNAQFMGLPIAPRSVIVVDGSSAMRNHIDLIKQAILRGAQSLGGDYSVQIIFWSQTAPIAYPAKLGVAAKLEPQALESHLESVQLSGSADPLPAITFALKEKPDQVTLVAKMMPDEAEAAQIEAQIKAAGSKLLVVHLEGREGDPEGEKMKNIAEASGGRYLTLSGARLKRWYEEYQNAPAAPTTPAPGPQKTAPAKKK